MSVSEEPLYNKGLIIPDKYAPRADLLDADDGAFITQWVKPISPDALTAGALDMAKAQWDAIFPTADERDRLMFMAGVSAALSWYAQMSEETREEFMENLPPEEYESVVCHDCGGSHEIFLSLDELDAWVANLGVRMVTTIFSFEDDPDLDDAFADLVESLINNEGGGDDAGTV